MNRQRTLQQPPFDHIMQVREEREGESTAKANKEGGVKANSNRFSEYLHNTASQGKLHTVTRSLMATNRFYEYLDKDTPSPPRKPESKPIEALPMQKLPPVVKKEKPQPRPQLQSRVRLPPQPKHPMPAPPLPDIELEDQLMFATWFTVLLMVTLLLACMVFAFVSIFLAWTENQIRDFGSSGVVAWDYRTTTQFYLFQYTVQETGVETNYDGAETWQQQCHTASSFTFSLLVSNIVLCALCLACVVIRYLCGHEKRWEQASKLATNACMLMVFVFQFLIVGSWFFYCHSDIKDYADLTDWHTSVATVDTIVYTAPGMLLNIFALVSVLLSLSLHMSCYTRDFDEEEEYKLGNRPFDFVEAE